MVFILPLAAVAVVVAGNLAYDYLFPDNDLPNVNDTTSLSDAPPYVPPFLGGQCVTTYRLRGTVFNPATGQNQPWVINGIQGKITSIQPFNDEGANGCGVRVNGAIELNGNCNFGRNYTLTSVERTDGLPDNCGNLPNPNSTVPPPIASGGVPQNTTPVITPNDQLVEGGLPVVFTPSVLSALAGLAAQIGTAIANAAAAADALAAAKATADAVGKLAQAVDAQKPTLDALRKYLNRKEREDATKKRYLIRQYGTILKDGYLDVTPRPAPVGFQPIMLDFLVFNVPSGLGRFFGKDSYNWFRYNELGSICFLSPTAGVLSVHKIEHLRTSIAIPELAIGFTYNLGLNGVIKARVSMLYTQEKTE